MATIDLDAGETITCTFTNTQLGTIIVEKQAMPDGDPTSFTFIGDVAASLSDGQTAPVGTAEHSEERVRIRSLYFLH